MSDKTKPREWWIDLDYSGDAGDHAIATQDERQLQTDFSYEHEIVHVIEMSTYDKLLAEYEELSKELDSTTICLLAEQNIRKELHQELVAVRITIANKEYFEGPGQGRLKTNLDEIDELRRFCDELALERQKQE